MKRLGFYACLMLSLYWTACNAKRSQSPRIQRLDSISKAVADSMLHEALKADTLKIDTIH